MNYCHNCGLQINEGDVFCTSCGTNQVNESKQEETQHKSFSKATDSNLNSKNDNTNYMQHEINFKMLGDIFVKLLVQPVLGSKQFIEECEKKSVIVFTILLAVVQGILGMWKVNQMISTLQDVIVGAFKQMAGLAGLFSASAASEFSNTNEITSIVKQIEAFKRLLNIPYGKIFIQNIIIFLIGVSLLFIVIILAMNILSHKKINAFQIFKTALIVSVPIIYFEAFSIIVSYLSIYFGMGVFLIGIVISISSLSIVLKDQLHINENTTAFIVAISSVIILIAELICLEKFITSNIMDVIKYGVDIFKGFL